MAHAVFQEGKKEEGGRFSMFSIKSLLALKDNGAPIFTFDSRCLHTLPKKAD